MTQSKTSRLRNGVRERLIGGYASWIGRDGKRRCKEVRVWAPSSVVLPGTEVSDAGWKLLQEKATGKWPKAEVREFWAY